ncbi:class I SAM-dependent methyltransferase [Acidimicrobiia bacterium EGI L10123]|uniref:class I SAM-dependent methyltransferase n=1 Tax=Salinilacustrithrix flava TaxID=2957203 RepID=UPI003D7C226A|nr:class I SAM-dependent methyltransferase [Acidimicrobiia bacterium EGI L10123]
MTSWMEIVAENPGHSSWYIERFRTMAANGDDLEGEARFVDAMVPRGARILDAGCGPGRVGGALHQRGHQVVGVDVDPALIEAAEQDHPGPTWLVGDLAELDLPSRGIEGGFDVIVCAGNVITFIPAADRRPALEHLGRHLTDDGRIAIGFGDHRGYGFDEFRADVDAAGLAIELELSTWDIRPFRESSDFMVALLRRT